MNVGCVHSRSSPSHYILAGCFEQVAGYVMINLPDVALNGGKFIN